MSFAEAAPVLTATATYVAEAGATGFWGALLSGLGEAAIAAGATLAKILPRGISSGSLNAKQSLSSAWHPLRSSALTLPSESSAPSQSLEPSRFSQTPRRLGEKALEQVRKLTPSTPVLPQLRQASRRLLNELAHRQGLPSYEEFHRQHALVYAEPPQSARLRIQEAFQQAQASIRKLGSSSPMPIPGAQKPVLYSQLANNSMPRWGNEPLAPLMAFQSSKPPQRKTLPVEEKRAQPKAKILAPLPDAELKQWLHVLDVQQVQHQTDWGKRLAAWTRLQVEQQLAQRLVAQAPRDSDGNVLLQGVPVRPEDALSFAQQDIQHFRETDRHLSPAQIIASTKLESGTSRDVTIFSIPGKLRYDNSGMPYIRAERPFTSTQGLAHYQQGTGIPVRIPINWIDTSKLTPLQFPEVQKALLDKTPRTIQIKGKNPRVDSTTLDTVGTSMGNILGRVTPKLSGTLTIHTDKTWTFVGNIKIWDDQYNFDTVPGRTPIAEVLTHIGMRMKGTPYMIQIRGEHPIQASGRIWN